MIKKRKKRSTQDKDINKQKKGKVKPTNAEIIDEDALDALEVQLRLNCPVQGKNSCFQ